ncbi:IGEB protein, partial [Oxyruncus cristatus]|nr:IGEB protein [Oxyruncus cristatus]
IKHITGIPHNPTGQGIVERAHFTIKNMLQKQKRGSSMLTPQEKLDKALFVLNFLNRLDQFNRTLQQRHFSSVLNPSEKAKVLYKDILTNEWKGPFPMV